MTSPLPLPDWVPLWVHLAILLVVLFVVLMYLLLPFSVFGTKSRLEAIEARLDEIQGEIRSLAMRLPESPYHEIDEEVRVQPRFRAAGPPIPPAPLSTRPPIPPPPARSGRTEPRL